MKLFYPVVIKKINDTLFTAYFPDLEGCSVKGDSIDDVLEEANAAALEWINVELMDEDGQLPQVSDADDLTLEEGEFVRTVSLTYRMTDGWEE